MFEQGGTLYAIVQIGNQVMQGSTVGNLQASPIDANGNATRYGPGPSNPLTGMFSPRPGRNDQQRSTLCRVFPLPRPVRLLDYPAGRTAACNDPALPLTGGTRSLLARAACQGVTIPANAEAVVGNAAVVNSISGSGPGYITLYPSDAVKPLAANLNYTANDIRSNAFTVGLGDDGKFDIFASTSTHFVVDITGYYAPDRAGGAASITIRCPIPCGGSTPERVKPLPAPTPARRSRLVCPWLNRHAEVVRARRSRPTPKPSSATPRSSTPSPGLGLATSRFIPATPRSPWPPTSTTTPTTSSLTPSPSAWAVMGRSISSPAARPTSLSTSRATTALM